PYWAPQYATHPKHGVYAVLQLGRKYPAARKATVGAHHHPRGDGLVDFGGHPQIAGGNRIPRPVPERIWRRPDYPRPDLPEHRPVRLYPDLGQQQVRQGDTKRGRSIYGNRSTGLPGIPAEMRKLPQHGALYRPKFPE